jgi:hypothetical protein
MGKAGQRFRTFAGSTSTNTKLASLDLPLEMNEKVQVLLIHFPAQLMSFSIFKTFLCSKQAPRCHPNATLSPLEAPEFRTKSEANASANAVVPAVPCLFPLAFAPLFHLLYHSLIVNNCQCVFLRQNEVTNCGYGFYFSCGN